MKILTRQYWLTKAITVGICSIIHPAFSQNAAPAMPLQNIIDSNAKVSSFAPGVVSTRYGENGASFSPNEQAVYFTMGSVVATVCCSKKVGGNWAKPEVASFSGRWNDMDAFVSPDGKRLFFCSNRPIPGTPQNVANKHIDLWYADNAGNEKWGAPQHLDTMINTGRANSFAPSVDDKGTLYWCSRDRDGHKGMQGYYSTWLGDHYGKPQLVQIPGLTQVQDPFIAANGKYLVVLSGRELYVSTGTVGNWSPAQKIGPPVSMGDNINSPFVSRNGKMLYFSTSRSDGFYKRDPLSHALTYDELEKECDGIFNGDGNILMVPVNLPAGE